MTDVLEPYRMTYGKIALDGLHNTRDLGGLPAEAGHVLPRRLLRSGSLASATPGDLDVLRNAYDVRLVIDLRTFQQTETLTVTQNPNKIVEVDDKVFLISWDYTQESYELQLIDPAQGNQVSRIGYATHVAGDDGVLYIIDSRID